MSVSTMDTAWPAAEQDLAALRAKARDLRGRANVIRRRAQHADDISVYREEMAEAKALDTEATALELIARQQETH